MTDAILIHEIIVEVVFHFDINLLVLGAVYLRRARHGIKQIVQNCLVLQKVFPIIESIADLLEAWTATNGIAESSCVELKLNHLKETEA